MIGVVSGAGCYVVGLLVVRSASARARAGARELTVCVGLTPEPLPSPAALALLEDLTRQLQGADDRRDRGCIDAVEHEQIWTNVWRRLPPS